MNNVPQSLYHYERMTKSKYPLDDFKEWVVYDCCEVFIIGFDSEEEAQYFVRKHNSNVGPNPSHWKF